MILRGAIISGVGDQYTDVSEDKEEAYERCKGEEQGCACDVGGAEEV